MKDQDICKRHNRYAIMFTVATMAVYGATFIGFIAVRDLSGFGGQTVSPLTISLAMILSATVAAICYCAIKRLYSVGCSKCDGKLRLALRPRCSRLQCENPDCGHTIQCQVGF